MLLVSEMNPTRPLSSNRAVAQFWSPESFENDLTIKVNEKIKRDALFKQLDAWGYVFSDWCSSKNMYASRGGIVDIFPALHKNPIRLELEGSRVVSLRVFNTVNQESIKEISKAVIHEPLTTKNDFQEQKLKDFFESNVNNIAAQGIEIRTLHYASVEATKMHIAVPSHPRSPIIRKKTD